MNRSLSLITKYIKECGDNAPKLQKILDDNFATFDIAKGSMHNHQAWEGGYLQHVADCMSLVTMHFNFSNKYWPLPFQRSSAMLVMFLHDIEKPYMQSMMAIKPDLQPWTKQQRSAFRLSIITRYNLQLTEEEFIALKYVEGEGDDYSPNKRVMNELGAMCHAIDTLSSRLWHSRNQPDAK